MGRSATRHISRTSRIPDALRLSEVGQGWTVAGTMLMIGERMLGLPPDVRADKDLPFERIPAAVAGVDPPAGATVWIGFGARLLGVGPR